MGNKHKLDVLPLSTEKELTTLVENRRVFTLNNFELNVYETYQESHLVPLRFNDVVIVNMLKGKKVMHLDGIPDFDYLPGETLILPAEKGMQIDFPEARMNAPTQCTALTIAKDKINDVIQYLNDFYPKSVSFKSWDFKWDNFHFDNDSEITYLTNKLFKLATSQDLYKEALADLTLKELLIRILQTQNLLYLNSQAETNDSPIAYIKAYVRDNLSMNLNVDVLCKIVNMSKSSLFREFKQHLGVSPMEYVIRERLTQSKRMLRQGSTVKESCYAVGFNDVNYFVRLFKKREGITPGGFASNLS